MALSERLLMAVQNLTVQIHLKMMVNEIVACAYAQKPSVLWRCWLDVKKSIRPVKIEWWGVGVVACLEKGADCLHMFQLMPLHPRTPPSLASFKSRLVTPFWYQLAQVVMEKMPLNGCSSSSRIICTNTSTKTCFVLRSLFLQNYSLLDQIPKNTFWNKAGFYRWDTLPIVYLTVSEHRTWKRKQLHMPKLDITDDTAQGKTNSQPGGFHLLS